MSLPHRRNRAFGVLLATLTSVLSGTVPLAGKVALSGLVLVSWASSGGAFV